ncbi:MAG: hypothetical protein KC422_18630 [Trueperaceae bacterium]|nr:hypothetical protein [Trueperaceae bacterium]
MTSSRNVFIQARNAGFRTFLAFWLTSALFAAPLLAKHQNFAHFHPEGTSYHIHAINALFHSEGAISQETFVSFSLLFILSFLGIGSVHIPLLRTGFLTRAPPLF